MKESIGIAKPTGSKVFFSLIVNVMVYYLCFTFTTLSFNTSQKWWVRAKILSKEWDLGEGLWTS